MSDIDIYKQAYADGYNAGALIAEARAESRQALGLPLVQTADYDAWLERIAERGEKIEFLAAARASYAPVQSS